MKLRIEAAGFKEALFDAEGSVAEAATEAMRETTGKAVRILRRQVVDAGLGQRLANTWRDRVYPERRRSTAPTGYVWSNASDIIDSFARGAQVVPIGGSRFLAIPTDAVPMSRSGFYNDGRRRSRRAMTPFEVETAFNQDLFFKRGRAGRVLAFINAVRSRNGRTIRRGTRGRLAQGRELKPILMFVLVPSVRMPKALDLDAAAAAWSADFAARFAARLEAL